MPRPLTEKTLELNVMAELAHLGRLAGYRPYFIGFSQLDELVHGGDTYYSVGSKIGFFQFKRGYHQSKFFTFYVNNNKPHFNQHETLCKTDKACGACRYVFPLVGSNEDVYKNRGRLLAFTAFLSPRLFDLSSEPYSIHRIRLYLDGRWEQYSEVKNEGNWRNIFAGLPLDSQPINEPPEFQSVGEDPVDRSTARDFFSGLELPNVERALDGIRGDNRVLSDIFRDIFKQRATFCMVFS